MIKTKNKKAFTIVELVIVIAVIAILAAVLIPTFSNVIKKAKQSSDTQLIRNINTALSTELAAKGKKQFDTAYDAFQVASEFGYDVSLIVAKSDFNIAYSYKDAMFVLLNEETGKVIFPEEDGDTGSLTVSGSDKANYYVVRCNIADSEYTESKGFSVYAGAGFAAKTVNIDGTSFDAGECKTIEQVNYVGYSVMHEVLIRTNGATGLRIEGFVDSSNPSLGDVVRHYGSAGKVEVVKVANASYHEFGAIDELKVAAGHVQIEESGFVYYVSANQGSISNEGFVAKAASGVTVSGNQITNKFAIASADELCSFRDMVNRGNDFEGLTVELSCNIELADGWQPIEGSFKGTFDGKGFTISNLNGNGLVVNASLNYGLFGQLIDECTIKNIKFANSNITLVNKNKSDKAINVAFVAGYVNAAVTISDIVVEETCSINITSKVCAGGIVGRWKNGSYDALVGALVKDCENHADMVLVDDQKQSVKAAGIIGFKDGGNIIVNLDNCVNTGDITGTSEKTVYLAGIITSNSFAKGPRLGVEIEVAAYYPYLTDGSLAENVNDTYTIKYVNNCYNLGTLSATANTKLVSELYLYTSNGEPINHADYYWYAESIAYAYKDDNQKLLTGLSQYFTPADGGDKQKNKMASILTNTFTYESKQYTIDVQTSGNTITLSMK